MSKMSTERARNIVENGTMCEAQLYYFGQITEQQAIEIALSQPYTKALRTEIVNKILAASNLI